MNRKLLFVCFKEVWKALCSWRFSTALTATSAKPVFARWLPRIRPLFEFIHPVVKLMVQTAGSCIKRLFNVLENQLDFAASTRESQAV
eukprot:1237407-Pleurochrysis_carterae.AAC.1